MEKWKDDSMLKMFEDPDMDELSNARLLDFFFVPPGVPEGHTNFSSPLSECELAWLYQWGSE